MSENPTCRRCDGPIFPHEPYLFNPFGNTQSHQRDCTKRQRSGGWYIIAALLILAGFAALSYYYYVQG